VARKRDQEPPPQSWLLGFLGDEIKVRREQRGMSQAELGRLTNYANKTVCSYETGDRVPQRAFIELADAALGADGALKRIYGRMIDGVHEPWFRWYVRLETEATEIRHFEPHLVPGLLQTEAYARSLYETHQPPLVQARIDAHVAGRMARQQLLLGERPMYAWFVIDEAVLRRWPHAGGVIGPQIEHLLRVSELPNVALMLIPFEQGHHAGRDGRFTVLSFPDSDDVGYVEPVGGGLIVSDSMRVATMRRQYDLLLSEALPPDKSRALIEKSLETL